MKKLAFTAVAVAALLALGTQIFASDTKPAPTAAPAAASTGVKIGIVDLRKIIETSDAGKSLDTQLRARQEALQKEATDYEKKLKDQEQEIIKKRKDLKPEEFEAKKKEFGDALNKSRQAILSKTTDLESVRKKALSDLQKAIGKSSAEVADAKKLQLIVDRQFVILAEEGMDITDDVLKNLNASVKSIKLSDAKK